MKEPVCRWNVQKMQAESSENVRKTTGFFTACEGSLGESLDESSDADHVVELVPTKIVVVTQRGGWSGSHTQYSSGTRLPFGSSARTRIFAS